MGRTHPPLSRRSRLAALLRRSAAWPFRFYADFAAIDGKTRMLVLAGQAFMTVLPCIIVVASIGNEGGGGADLGNALVRRMHLTGPAAAAMRALFSHPPAAGDALNTVGIVLLVLSALSLARSLQSTFEGAWRLSPARGLRAASLGLAGTTLLVGQVVVLAELARVFPAFPGSMVVGLLVRLGVSFLAWVAIEHLLVSGRVGLARLAPGAVVGAAAQGLASLFSALYMPHLVARDASRYGTVGVTLALLSWLVVAGAGICAIAVFGAELAGVPAAETKPPASGDWRAVGGEGAPPPPCGEALDGPARPPAETRR